MALLPPPFPVFPAVGCLQLQIQSIAELFRQRADGSNVMGQKHVINHLMGKNHVVNNVMGQKHVVNNVIGTRSVPVPLRPPSHSVFKPYLLFAAKSPATPSALFSLPLTNSMLPTPEIDKPHHSSTSASPPLLLGPRRFSREARSIFTPRHLPATFGTSPTGFCASPLANALFSQKPSSLSSRNRALLHIQALQRIYCLLASYLLVTLCSLFSLCALILSMHSFET